ncbi:hypothetical protein ACFLSJ_01445 [Verrucomicrobiota bacterium]
MKRLRPFQTLTALALLVVSIGCGDKKMRERIAALDEATLVEIQGNHASDSKPGILIAEELQKRGIAPKGSGDAPDPRSNSPDVSAIPSARRPFDTAPRATTSSTVTASAHYQEHTVPTTTHPPSESSSSANQPAVSRAADVTPIDTLGRPGCLLTPAKTVALRIIQEGVSLYVKENRADMFLERVLYLLIREGGLRVLVGTDFIEEEVKYWAREDVGAKYPGFCLEVQPLLHNTIKAEKIDWNAFKDLADRHRGSIGLGFGRIWFPPPPWIQDLELKAEFPDDIPTIEVKTVWSSSDYTMNPFGGPGGTKVWNISAEMTVRTGSPTVFQRVYDRAGWRGSYDLLTGARPWEEVAEVIIADLKRGLGGLPE